MFLQSDGADPDPLTGPRAPPADLVGRPQLPRTGDLEDNATLRPGTALAFRQVGFAWRIRPRCGSQRTHDSDPTTQGG